MASLRVHPDRLEIHLTAAEKTLAFRREDVVIQRENIRSVTITDDPWIWVRGIRAPGALVPLVLAVGVWKFHGGKDFLAIKRRRQAVVIDLTGDDFARVILSTNHAPDLIASLKLEATDAQDVPELDEPAKPVKPAKRVRTPKAAKPVETSHLVDAAAPVKPARRARPGKAVGTVEAAETAEPIESIASAAPVKPARRVRTAKPVTVVEPAEAVEPAVAVKPKRTSRAKVAPVAESDVDAAAESPAEPAAEPVDLPVEPPEATA
ncbi:hypothetical protein RCH12_003052 [Cryobacterium sp. MP_3.1]|uniref:hypothetical protein n=1 Tax=Cryobacterium sp. MP_3.1 TaxID=3071711 RepID=UPI002E098591|nr:hypothetical protein [Cryobacterium sp. MP_3.1]